MSNDAHGALVRLSYRKIRDVSTKEEEENGAATYIAVMPASEILKVGTEGNLRSYIPDHPGKKRSVVHKQIENTIQNRPERFSQMNSGFLIGASRVEVDDNKKVVTIHDASVNNGAQSQGEIRRYFENEDATDFPIRVEVSAEPDQAMRTEIAIARNTATRIQDISQAGKRGYFNDLAKAFAKAFPDNKLALSETDIGDEYVDTRFLLQVLWAMLPQELMPPGRVSIEARMRAYKNAASCLTDFEKIYLERETEEDQAARYKYFVDMAGDAWRAYVKWSTHPEWARRYLREDAKQVKRKNGGHVVADGLVFPILAALSHFVEFDEARNRWALHVPKVFRDEDMIEAARRQLKQHQGKPVYMGRSGAAYEGLMLLTEMAIRYGEKG
jgi:hypothetical protein